MLKVLLTAFEPFDGRPINASQEAARFISDCDFEGAKVELLKVPVERFPSTRIVLDAVGKIEPDIVVMLGEARGRSAITPERVAINVDDYPIPDNAGNQPREEIIVEGGPAAYFSTLPIVAIRDALNGHDIPATISNSAGTYLCNRIFYSVMHHLWQTESAARAGFIHIPLLTESKPVDVEVWPSLPREQVFNGVRLAIETCIQEYAAV